MHLFMFGAFNFDKIQITSSLMSVFGVCVFVFFFLLSFMYLDETNEMNVHMF